MLYRISVAERALTGIANIFSRLLCSLLSGLDDLLRAGTVPLTEITTVFYINPIHVIFSSKFSTLTVFLGPKFSTSTPKQDFNFGTLGQPDVLGDCASVSLSLVLVNPQGTDSLDFFSDWVDLES